MQIDSSDVHADCRRVEVRLQTLLAATLRLSESIDYAQTLESVVSFVAARFASFAVLDIALDEQRVGRVAVAHRDPEFAARAEALRRFVPRLDLVATHPVARAVARGVTTLDAIDEAWIARAALNAEHAATMRALDIVEVLVVPVVARTGAVLGALTCALDARADRAHYDRDDVVFAEELGRRAGLAIENARLYEHEHRIAAALQDASLPRILPRIEGLRLDAHYRPGRDEATIGGDWYDAFVLGDGRVVLTMGDVVGSGLDAAVTMTKLRQAMQAAAMLRPEPEAMLDVAERTLRLHDPAGYATAIAAIYDCEAALMTIASAGHPPPLIVRRDGSVDLCRARGLMLGVELGTPRRPDVVFAVPGESFVFYTDGLTEMSKDIEAGERRLREAVARRTIMRLPRPAREIVETLLAESTHLDDVALMTVAIVASPATVRGSASLEA